MMFGRLKLFRKLREEAARLFKQHWLCFAGIAASFAIPVMLINKYFWRNPDLVLRIINRISIDVFVVFDDAVYFVILICFFWTLAALILAIRDADSGGRPGVITSFAWAMRILDSYLWVKALFIFKVFCWSLLLVIPGIIFGVLYNFAGMALAVDDKRGQEAFIYSKKIIAANIYDYLFCTGLVSVLLVLSCAALILSLDLLMAYFSSIGNAFLAAAVDALEVGLVAMACVVFLIFYYYLYKTLRDNKGSA